MKKLILLGILFIPFTLFGQLHKIEVGTIPSTLFDPVNHYFRFGVRYLYNDKISVGADFGFAPLFYSAEKSKEYNFLTFRPEVDFSLRRGKRSNWYLGMEYFVFRQNETENDYSVDLVSSVGPVELTFDKVHLTKIKEGVNMKIGYQLFFGKFFFDIFTGLGYAHKFISYSDYKNAVIRYTPTDGTYNTLGYHSGPNLTFGLRFGLTF